MGRRAVRQQRKSPHPVTPDGRYFVVQGRLWRCTNPSLDPQQRQELTRTLMAARRAKQVAMRAADRPAQEAARQQVDAAKVALGERGEVWWADGAPDYNRCMARTTVYAEWYLSLPREEAPRTATPVARCSIKLTRSGRRGLDQASGGQCDADPVVAAHGET